MIQRGHYPYFYSINFVHNLDDEPNSATHHLINSIIIMPTKMKNLFFLLFVGLFLSACQTEAPDTDTSAVEIDMDRYPENMQKVLAAHGGIDRWNEMNSLSYERVNSAGNEVHSIDLKGRRDRIVAPDFEMGFDGSQYWVQADTSFKRDPVFYHNLMFYFYAMPFVLADEGIQYSEVEPVVLDSVSYPGIKMTFGDDVGSSPKDDYIIYYNPDTYQMEWLAYTATYFSQKKSDKYGYIRYKDWGNFNGLVLPNSLTWYRTNDEGQVTEPRNTVQFENIKVDIAMMADGTFTAPPGAKISE
ncbi:MAG: hypothetical protein Sapg2KO_42360 [Saprospiraceae bacterium]